jgi:hypothetical protein
MNDDLLEHRPALAADLGRQRATDQSGPDRLVANVSPDVGVDAPARALEVELEGLEDLAREATRSIPKVDLFGSQRQIHAGKDGARDKRLRATVAGRGTWFCLRNGRGPVGDRPPAVVPRSKCGRARPPALRRDTATEMYQC